MFTQKVKSISLNNISREVFHRKCYGFNIIKKNNNINQYMDHMEVEILVVNHPLDPDLESTHARSEGKLIHITIY